MCQGRLNERGKHLVCNVTFKNKLYLYRWSFLKLYLMMEIKLSYRELFLCLFLFNFKKLAVVL